MLQQLLRRLVFDVPQLTEYCKMPIKVSIFILVDIFNAFISNEILCQYKSYIFYVVLRHELIKFKMLVQSAHQFHTPLHHFWLGCKSAVIPIDPCICNIYWKAQCQVKKKSVSTSHLPLHIHTHMHSCTPSRASKSPDPTVIMDLSWSFV